MEYCNMFNIPKMFGKYRVVRMIEEGTSSLIVLVCDIETKKEYACKVLNRTQLAKAGKLAEIEQEIHLLKALDSNYVVKIQDIVVVDDFLGIIIEYCSGGDLYSYIFQNSPLQEYEIIRIFRQILFGLEYLHKSRIAHRDIKPENILLDKNYNIKICDFDSASLIPQNMLLSDQRGSLYYAAPEVIKRVPYDGFKADIWSLGIVMYLMTTGTLPWKDGQASGIFMQIVNSKINIPTNTPKLFQELLREMLQQDPEKRPDAYTLLKKLDGNDQPESSMRRRKSEMATCSSRRRKAAPCILVPSKQSAVISSPIIKRTARPRFRALSTD